MQNRLILISDKFKEQEFNEQVKKIWRTLKVNEYKPAKCLTEDFCKAVRTEEENKNKNPENLNWKELEKFTCYRSHVTETVLESKVRSHVHEK